mmetsp:Transcript_10896/g.16251  ORF Transcript_10896/g.16251 Transcript_10896/m.16251 type:complete len:438 (+) Transcript_10896:172-1485(+)
MPEYDFSPRSSTCKRCGTAFSIREAHDLVCDAQRERVSRLVMESGESSMELRKVRNIRQAVAWREILLRASHQDEQSKISLASSPWRCAVCGLTFTQMSALEQHIRISPEHLSKKYRCPLPACRKSFRLPSYLRRHIIYTHGPMKPNFRCRICGVQFKTRDHQLRHSLVHTRDKPYNCSFCNKTFRQRSQINVHVRITHKKGHIIFYNCSVCERPFTRKWNLKVHQYQAHPEVFVRPISNEYDQDTTTRLNKVQLCDNSTGLSLGPDNLKDNLDMSQKRTVTEKAVTDKQKGIQCSLCGAGFSFLGSLDLHMSGVHHSSAAQVAASTKNTSSEQEIQWECATCGLTFKRHMMYRKHANTFRHLQTVALNDESSQLRNSDTEKKCLPCGQTFRNLRAYKRHLGTISHQQKSPNTVLLSQLLGPIYDPVGICENNAREV